MEQSLVKKEADSNITPLWVGVCVLNRTIKQLLPVIEKNLEASKHSALEIISKRSNGLIDCLSKGMFITPEMKLNTELYQKLINSLVDITLVANNDIKTNEVGLLHECANHLSVVEQGVRVTIETV